MEIKLIRMSSGEDVLAEIVSQDDDSISLINPIVAVPAGNGQIGFAPWSPLLDKDMDPLVVSKQFIVWMTDPSPNVVEEYKKMFSNIVLPDSNLIL